MLTATRLARICLNECMDCSTVGTQRTNCGTIHALIQTVVRMGGREDVIYTHLQQKEETSHCLARHQTGRSSSSNVACLYNDLRIYSPHARSHSFRHLHISTMVSYFHNSYIWHWYVRFNQSLAGGLARARNDLKYSRDLLFFVGSAVQQDSTIHPDLSLAYLAALLAI